jgi:hypothetical protein
VYLLGRRGRHIRKCSGNTADPQCPAKLRLTKMPKPKKKIVDGRKRRQTYVIGAPRAIAWEDAGQ